MESRIISLWQPWASLVALGEKRLETRPWKTSFRGRLYIHAAKHKAREMADLFYENPSFAPEMLRVFPLTKYCDLPRGCIVAQCELVDCITTEEALKDLLDAKGKPANEQSGREIIFGNYNQYRYAWKLADIKPTPLISCVGHQGMWKPAQELEMKLKETACPDTRQE